MILVDKNNFSLANFTIINKIYQDVKRNQLLEVCY